MSHNADSDTVIYVLIQEWCTITSVYFLCHFIVEVKLNETCTTGQPSDQCLDAHAECNVSGTLQCLCNTGYYANSVGVCAQSKLSYLTNAIILKGTMCCISACVN